MSTSYYGMSFNPFDITLSTNDAFLTSDMKEMNNRLTFLKNNPGIGLFTANPGQGKTFAARCFSSTLNHNITKFSYICLSTVTMLEFYRQFCDHLGIDVISKKSKMFRAIQEFFQTSSQNKKIHHIVCFDEAQYLNFDILRELKMLANFSMDSKICFSIILLGQPTIINTLLRQPHEAFRQRITVSYNFVGISEAEAMQYIRSRFALASASPSIMDDNAMLLAYTSSGSSIRRLNQIISKSLMIGAQHSKNVIDTDILLSAVNDIELA